MTDTNEHTGARLVTKPTTPAYEEGFDRIFGKKEVPELHKATHWVVGGTDSITQANKEISDVYNQNHDPM